jgi:hypothetical protein
MNRSQVLVTLLEEIAGNAAIVYHRTGASAFTDPTGKVLSGKDIPENIIQHGFAEGKDGMYGPGIYATYKLKSQFNTYMERYGEYLVKCRVNLQGYILLDYVEAKKVYRERYALHDQLSQYYSPQWLDRKSEDIVWYDEQLRRRQLTSSIAADLYGAYQINTVVPGMLFTGGHDDAVIITYRPAYILPIEYAYHPVGAGTPVKWTALDTSGYVGHLQKVGTLIRTPSVKKIGAAEFSALFQDLSGLTKLTKKQITTKLSKIKFLSTNWNKLSYKPDFATLPAALSQLIHQKFAYPDVEFYTVIRSFLDERFVKETKKFCLSLQSHLPGTLVDCQPQAPPDNNTLKVTFTFPTSKSLVLFLEGTLMRFENLDAIVDFLRADTHVTREKLARGFIEVLFPGDEPSKFAFNLAFSTMTQLVQNAPSTK